MLSRRHQRYLSLSVSHAALPREFTGVVRKLEHAPIVGGARIKLQAWLFQFGWRQAYSAEPEIHGVDRLLGGALSREAA